jgi:hypothetical protein
MHRLPLAAFLAAGLAALVAFATPPFATADAPDASQREIVALATHTVEITYSEQQGDLRNATIRITPREGSARRLGDIEALGFLSSGHTPGSNWHLLSSVRQSREGVIEARGRVPAPELLQAFAIRTATRTHMWGSSSAQGDGDDREEPKEAGDGDGEGDRDGGCTNICMEIIDPWTCECSDPNPFPDKIRRNGTVTFDI